MQTFLFLKKKNKLKYNTNVLFSYVCCVLESYFVTVFFCFFFFFNDTATTEIYTLSLHDALPILEKNRIIRSRVTLAITLAAAMLRLMQDRKSTRLNPVTSLSRMPSSA